MSFNIIRKYFDYSDCLNKINYHCKYCGQLYTHKNTTKMTKHLTNSKLCKIPHETRKALLRELNIFDKPKVVVSILPVKYIILIEICIVVILYI